MSKKKYHKGQPIRSLDELWAQDLVFFHHKVVSHGWFQNWSFRYASQQIFFGRIFCTEKEDK